MPGCQTHPIASRVLQRLCGCVPLGLAWLCTKRGLRDQTSENKPTDPSLSSCCLTWHRYTCLAEHTFRDPQPLLPSKRLVGCSQESQVRSGQEQMYTCLCTGGCIIPRVRSPGMSTILCASREARILCDQAHTVSEKLVCISYTNSVSSDALPSRSAQPENLLGLALTA